MPYMSTYRRSFGKVHDRSDAESVVTGMEAEDAQHGWLDKRDFSIGVSKYRIHDTTFLKTQSTPTISSKNGAGRAAGDVVGIALVHEGSARLTSGDTTLQVERGDCHVFDDNEFVYENDSYHDRSMVVIPRSRLWQLGLNEKNDWGQEPFIARDGVADILFGHLHAVEQRLNRGPELSRNALAGINAATTQMIATLLAENGPAQEADVVSAAKAYMDGRLHDADLTPADVATAVHVSTRTLYRFFQRSGEGVTEYMRGARLLRAKEEFDLRGGTVKINVVADRWGFADKSHFASLFRQRFGCLPSDYVKGGQPTRR